jgi:hypothetical protein
MQEMIHSLDVIHPLFIVFSGMNGLASSALFLLVQAKRMSPSGGELFKKSQVNSRQFSVLSSFP